MIWISLEKFGEVPQKTKNFNIKHKTNKFRKKVSRDIALRSTYIKIDTVRKILRLRNDDTFRVTHTNRLSNDRI